MSGLFQMGEFTLASGLKSNWKIECDAITPSEWETLAIMLLERLEPFSMVYGVPRGGEHLAKILSNYRENSATRALVVDDVWTTGGSMNNFIHSLQGMDLRYRESWRPQRAVIFARNPTPPEVVALFTMGV